ncbi:hypothetical protein ACWATR_35465 [Nostoc sp. UIC 10890]
MSAIDKLRILNFSSKNWESDRSPCLIEGRSLIKLLYLILSPNGW